MKNQGWSTNGAQGLPSDGSEHWFVSGFEPAFSGDEAELDPQFGSVQRSAEFLSYLCRRIQVQPENLKAHMQRVRLSRREGNADALFGALVDLNIATGGRGRALRKRLLRESSGLLSAHCYEFLKARLDTGIDALEPLVDQCLTGFSAVRLTESLHANLPILNRQPVSQRQSRPVIDEVHDLLIAGEIVAAVDLLETAVFQSPHDQALAEELLDIYRRISDPAAFFAAWGRLSSVVSEDETEIRQLWVMAEQFFLAAQAGSQ